MPIPGPSQELLLTQNNEDDIPSSQRSPGKGESGSQGASQDLPADDLVPPYAHMPPVLGVVDMDTVKNYMHNTNAKIDALTLTVSGLTKWMENYMPVVHKTAIASGVDMGPGASSLGATYSGMT